MVTWVRLWVWLLSTIRSLEIGVLLPWLVVRLGWWRVVCASCCTSSSAIELIWVPFTLADWWLTSVGLLRESRTTSPSAIGVNSSTAVSTVAWILRSLWNIRVLSPYFLMVLSWAIRVVNVLRGWLLLRTRGSSVLLFIRLLNSLLSATLTCSRRFFTGSATSDRVTQVVPWLIRLCKHLLNSRSHINCLIRVSCLRLATWSLLLMLMSRLVLSLLFSRWLLTPWITLRLILCLWLRIILLLSYCCSATSRILLLTELLLLWLWVRWLVSTIHEGFIIIGQLVPRLIGVILLLVTACLVIKLISKLLLNTTLLLLVLILLPPCGSRLLILLLRILLAFGFSVWANIFALLLVTTVILILLT